MSNKKHCGGRWTEAQKHSFIKSLLRSGTRRWAPIQDVKRNARVRRGFYLCNGCKKEIPASIKENGKRVNFVFVDHVIPVVDPSRGFVSWDEVIERLFCEADNLQVLCGTCHDKKTDNERSIATDRRKKEK